MIGKFVTASVLLLLVLTILLGGQGLAQTTPAGQTPAAPATTEPTPAAPAPATPVPATATPTAQKPDSGQEPADEISSSRRRVRPHDFKNWNFNASIGANLDSGKTKEFVRGGGGAATAGVARNVNKYLGLRADFIWANLPLRQSVLGQAQATSATSNVFAVTLDPIINVPVTHLYTGYVLFGGGYFHRFGHLDDDTTTPGSACTAFWDWWGACSNSIVSIPLNGSFVNASQNQFGYNVGGGVARKVHGNVEVYVEYRLLHGASNGINTDFRPMTVGARW